MAETPAQICILGGGFAGLYTALHLNRLPWSRLAKPQITLVDKEDRFLFTPFLYELITGELQMWEIAPPYVKLLAGTDIQFHRATVQGVDLAKRQVQLQAGEILSYDRLVLATGKEPLLDVVPGAADYAYPFRTLADAQRLDQRLQVLETSNRDRIRVVIAGGGPSGVELAGKLADRLQTQGHICLIERGEQILKPFTSFSRKTAYRVLAAHRVQISLETSIETIGPDQITLACQGQIHTIPVDLVLWTVGTQTSEWLHHLAHQPNSLSHLLTHPTLQLIDHPDIFALGDLADIPDMQGKQVPATAQAAYQQASCAARNLQASLIGRPLLQFRYWHLGEMLTLGTQTGIVSSFGFINLKGRLAYITRRLIYLLLRMPTLRHRLRVGRHWLRSLILKWLPSPGGRDK